MKSKFVDAQECAEYIEERRNAEEYTLNISLASDISESTVNACKIYSLSKTDSPEYTILYLHGART